MSWIAHCTNHVLCLIYLYFSNVSEFSDLSKSQVAECGFIIVQNYYNNPSSNIPDLSFISNRAFGYVKKLLFCGDLWKLHHYTTSFSFPNS